MALVLNGSDTSAGDDAGLGYTAAEGLILTGQGSTSDVTIKNDADQTVLSIPTGTTQVGIGLTNPTGKFAVSDGTVNYELNPAGSVGYMGTRSNHDVAIQINASEKMRITTTGNVGIGTTGTGDNKLTVEGGVAATNGSSLALKSGGGANSRVADLAFYGTFVTPDTDTGHRRTADITSGYATGNWGNEYLAFGVGTGGANDSSAVTTERMRIAGDGNVGIGTSSPVTQLHIQNQSGNSEAILGQYGTGTKLQTGAFANLATIRAYNGTNDALAFWTGASERMRIDASGNLLVGTTNTSLGIGNTNTGFQVENTGTFLASRADNIAGSLNRNNDGSILSVRRSGTEVGTIGVTASTTSYNTSSDYRLKENVSYTFDATTRLKQLKPARFNFISDDTNTLVDGFIAHEVSSVVPEAVTGEKDGEEMQGIDQSKLVPLLVKTIQELEARITALEAG